MATGFLGYNHSHKWSKFNSNNQNISSFNDKNKTYKNIYLIQKRNYSNYLSYSSPLLPAYSPTAGDKKCQPVDNDSSNLDILKNEGTPNSLRSVHGSYLLGCKAKYGSLHPSVRQARCLSTKTPGEAILSNFIKEKKLTPVYSYEDLQLDETRKKILRETKGLSGIYLILNKVTLDYYIGSASTDRFYARFSNHLIYFKGSKVVKNAVRKYKLSNFVFLILELFPPCGEIVTKENNKKLIDREDLYLKTLLPNYNILTEAGSSFGYKHTEIDRLKMKSNYSLERKLKIGNLNRGKKLSGETIEKIREKALTRDRTKINLSEQSLLNLKKNSKPIILFNLDRTVFGEYNSITDAAKAINCNVKTVIRALQTEKKLLKKRFIVKYIDK
jgi:group I intron endonuclease